MDERFKKLDDEMNAGYKQSFWEAALAELQDDELDNAFKNAAAMTAAVPPLKDVSSELENAFLDDSFKVFADKIETVYNPTYWSQFEAARPDIELDEAFLTAANNVKTNYNSSFWNEANAALENEGLHYEYNANYWNEAKLLLEKEDRQKFIFKWSAVATVLLLISLAGLNTDLLPTNFSNVANGINGVDQVDDQQISDEIYARDANKLSAVENKASSLDENITNSQIASNTNEIETATNLNQRASKTDDLYQNINHTNSVQNTTNNITNDKLEPSLTNARDENQNNQHSSNNDSEIIQSIEEVIDVVEPESRLMGYKKNTQTEEILTPENTNSQASKINSNETLTLNPVLTSPYKIKNADFYYAQRIQIIPLPLKPHFNVNIFAQIGGGNNYGEDTYSYNSRMSGGIELLRSTRSNRYEYGLSIQANAIQPNNLNVEHREKIYLYNGNTDRTWFRVKYKKLLFLNANALFNYYLAPKHKLKFGVGVERIISVQSNLAFQKDIRRGIETENNNWGISDGLQTYDMRISFGYGFILNNRFEANINANFGLTDRTDNTFMLNDFMDREMNLMVGLNYKLFSGKK